MISTLNAPFERTTIITACGYVAAIVRTSRFRCPANAFFIFHSVFPVIVPAPPNPNTDNTGVETIRALSRRSRLYPRHKSKRHIREPTHPGVGTFTRSFVVGTDKLFDFPNARSAFPNGLRRPRRVFVFVCPRVISDRHRNNILAESVRNTYIYIAYV